MEEKTTVYFANFNGKEVKITSESDMIGYVFNILLRRADLQYSPLEAIKENLRTAVDMLCEFLTDVRMARVKDGQKKSALGVITRMISRLNSYKEFVSKITDKDKLIVSAYNHLLSYEGSGLLHGFGMSNCHGDRLIGNPEIVSYRVKEVPLKKIKGCN